MDPLAAARALALEQGHENPLGEEDAGGEVRDGNAHAHRPLARQAGDGHEPTHPLRDLVVARPVAIGPALSEARDAAVDQAGVVLAESLVVDPEAPLHVGAEVLHDDVGLGDEPLENVDALRRLEVERDRPLVPVEVLTVEAAPGKVALLVLTGGDLYHLRAHVGELTHARGTRARAGEIDHGVGRQRQAAHVRAP
jgi:hypothetical protein